jgi:hypothetical protein
VVILIITDRILDRFKARIIARSFSQIYRINYFETFVLTVQMNTLQIFLAIVAAKD